MTAAPQDDLPPIPDYIPDGIVSHETIRAYARAARAPLLQEIERLNTMLPANAWAWVERAERAEAERDDLETWDGLMRLLDKHWPASIFPTLPDDDKRSTGPRIISLMRWVKQEQERAERAEAELDALKELLREAREHMKYHGIAEGLRALIDAALNPHSFPE